MNGSQRRRTIAVLWFATWAAFLCVGIPLAVLPRYVHDVLGGGDVAAGFAVGALSLAAMLARPFGGRVADERGRRLAVTAGLMLCTAGGALMFAANTYPVLVAARMIVGAGEAWTYAAAMAWALDLTPASRHGSAISLFGMAIWLGATVGTATGELLLETLGNGSVADAPWPVIWATVTVIPALGLAAMHRSAAPPPRAPRTGPRAPLVLPAAVRPGISLALANLGYGAVAALVTLHLAARGLGSPGLTLTAVAAAVAVTRIAVAWALDRTGARRVLTAGCLLQAGGLAVIAGAHHVAAAIIGGLLLGAGYAAVFPALGLMVVRAAPEEQRGAALGSFTAFLDLGLAIAAPLAGVLAVLAGRPQAFVIAAAFTLTALLVAPRQRTPDTSRA